jgi:hypothetical protein
VEGSPSQNVLVTKFGLSTVAKKTTVNATYVEKKFIATTKDGIVPMSLLMLKEDFQC